MDKTTFLSGVGENQRDVAEVLFRAQEEGLRVSISEDGTSGLNTGTISELRVENERLVMKVGGRKYRPFYGFSVKILETAVRADVSETAFLKKVPQRLFAEANFLLQAQKNGLRVLIRKDGVEGEATGRVSDLRMQDGELVFSLDGHQYKNPDSVAILPQVAIPRKQVVKEPDEILKACSSRHSAPVQALLTAQADGLRVSIEEDGQNNWTVGRISDVRLEDGEVVFKVEERDYKPVGNFTVEILGRRTVRHLSAILQAMKQDGLVKDLIKAQTEGLRVRVMQLGISTERVGRVSDVRIEQNGNFEFKIEGIDFGQFRPIAVDILGPHIELWDRKEVLENAGENRAAVELLYKAQDADIPVVVSGGGVCGTSVGLIKDIRIVNGMVVFDVGDWLYHVFKGCISVRLLD